MYWTGNSIDNLLSYCGLVDARISASENDLPVQDMYRLPFRWKCYVLIIEAPQPLILSIELLTCYDLLNHRCGFAYNNGKL